MWKEAVSCCLVFGILPAFVWRDLGKLQKTSIHYPTLRPRMEPETYKTWRKNAKHWTWSFSLEIMLHQVRWGELWILHKECGGSHGQFEGLILPHTGDTERYYEIPPPPLSQYKLGHFQYIIISLATHLFFCTFLLITMLLALVVDVRIASKTALPVLITVAIW